MVLMEYGNVGNQTTLMYLERNIDVEERATVMKQGEEDNLYAVGSRPSSGRRASNDDLTVPPSEVESGKQVEER